MILVNFTHPQYLFLLAVIPLLIFLHFFLLKMKRSDAIRFANFDAIARIRGIDLYSKNLTVIAINSLIVILIVFSLSGLNVQREMSSSAHSYVIALDTSQSMEAIDVLPSRIDAARSAAKNFIDFAPPGTKVAIISFSGSAFIEQELTVDKSLSKSGLDSIQLSSIGGTDPAEAIISGTNVLANEDGKAIILISDGRINVGDTENALDYAKDNNVIVHTIGVGTVEGGETSFGISKIEEESLQSAAYETGGKYFRVGTANEMSDSFQSILEYKVKKVSFDLSRQMLFFALVLLIIQYVLSNTKYKLMP